MLHVFHCPSFPSALPDLLLPSISPTSPLQLPSPFQATYLPHHPLPSVAQPTYINRQTLLLNLTQSSKALTPLEPFRHSSCATLIQLSVDQIHPVIITGLGVGRSLSRRSLAETRAPEFDTVVAWLRWNILLTTFTSCTVNRY